jgi:cAMP-dependent protein kinase regulator
VHPTVTLHLPREEFIGLIRDHPAILAGLYLVAVERDEETTSVLGEGATAIVEDFDLV